MALKISKVENGNSPSEEKVWIKATTVMSTKGYAITDRTFAEDQLSNEFRHIYILPEINLKINQSIVLYTGKGTNGWKTYTNSDDQYYALYWGSDQCVWNNNGADTATLLSYLVVDNKNVPKV